MDSYSNLWVSGKIAYKFPILNLMELRNGSHFWLGVWRFQFLIEDAGN